MPYVHPRLDSILKLSQTFPDCNNRVISWISLKTNTFIDIFFNCLIEVLQMSVTDNSMDNNKHWLTSEDPVQEHCDMITYKCDMTDVFFVLFF